MEPVSQLMPANICACLQKYVRNLREFVLLVQYPKHVSLKVISINKSGIFIRKKISSGDRASSEASATFDAKKFDCRNYYSSLGIQKNWMPQIVEGRKWKLVPFLLRRIKAKGSLVFLRFSAIKITRKKIVTCWICYKKIEMGWEQK